MPTVLCDNSPLLNPDDMVPRPNEQNVVQVMCDFKGEVTQAVQLPARLQGCSLLQLRGSQLGIPGHVEMPCAGVAADSLPLGEGPGDPARPPPEPCCLGDGEQDPPASSQPLDSRHGE